VARGTKLRVEGSFSSADKESVAFYLQSLMATEKDYADGLRRSGALMLILAAVFELLLRGVIKQTTIGPLVLSSTKNLEVFVPTAVAYFFYDALNCGVNYEIVASVYTETFAVWNATAEANDLDVIIRPRTPAYFPAGGGRRTGISPFADLIAKIQSAFVVVVLLGPALFLGYAFYQLFGLLHPSSILLWVNVLISTALLVMGYWQGFALASEED
jgi:hypothetical protein